VVGGGVALEVVATTARSLGVEGGLCFRRGASDGTWNTDLWTVAKLYIHRNDHVYHQLVVIDHRGYGLVV
jgi:hypothetical protein